jgi:hypothetical protein
MSVKTGDLKIVVVVLSSCCAGSKTFTLKEVTDAANDVKTFVDANVLPAEHGDLFEWLQRFQRLLERTKERLLGRGTDYQEVKSGVVHYMHIITLRPLYFLFISING